MKRSRAIAIFLATVIGAIASLHAQPAPSITFDWEVRNRFRLFSHEDDFEKHVAAWKNATGDAGRILASERTLAAMPDSGGHGWARHMRLCVNRANGRLLAECERVDSDGNTLKERMVNPRSHRIKFQATLAGAQALAGAEEATCIWSFGKGFVETKIERPCAQQVNNRLSKGVAAPVSLSLRLASGALVAGPTNMVEARDILIVGMGDSIASGEGNPNDPVRLRGDGFCYRRAGLGNVEYYLPAREIVTGVTRACPDDTTEDVTELFSKTAARWLYAQCHRSLYSHQTRTALALAVENPKIAVTYIPLGCSGAEIQIGMIGSQQARERPTVNGRKAPRDATAQFTELASYVGANSRVRRPDLVLLTVGANDIGFGGLVSDVVVSPGEERRLLQRSPGLIVTPAQAQAKLDQKLQNDFKKLRARLAGFIGDFTDRVIFTAYGNPAKDEDGEVCKTSRRGFDAHPAFAVDGAKLAATSNFVETKFIPKLRALSQCAQGGGCTQPAKQTMAFVNEHQNEFAKHGFCAASTDEPVFDRDCFRDGVSFANADLNQPMACSHSAAAFRAYVSRARWIRTANDSYFTAMTYSATLPLQPSDVHDALWGLSAVVHGGAIHPTAEGHAAMGDAVITAARKALKLPVPPAP